MAWQNAGWRSDHGGWYKNKATGGPPWAPSDVPLAFWYDASNAASLTLVGSAVTAWADLSGNSGRQLTNAPTAPVTMRPILTTGNLNGKNTVHWQNILDSMQNSQMQTAVFTEAQPLTVVFALKTGAGALGASGGQHQYAILMDGDRDGQAANRLLIGEAWASGSPVNSGVFYAGSIVSTGVIPAVSTNYHQAYVLDGAASSSNINGTIVNGDVGGTAGIVNGINIGGAVSSGTSTVLNAVDVYIGEIIGMKTRSASDLSNALAYILAKWGV